MKIEEKKVIAVRPIPGYEGLYSATSDGKVYRHPRQRTKPGFVKLRSNTVYSRVPLWKDGITQWHHVHRLVASAFLLNPFNKPQVNHKDGNTSNNVVSNLEWVTASENVQHAFDTGLYKMRGEKSVFAKLTNKKVLEIRSSELNQYELADKYGVSQMTVSRIVRRVKWKHI